jgi:2-polyprenyl-3-methyl-5-hydroxy-6-metoxy-1,4-benzoquinol methylase
MRFEKLILSTWLENKSQWIEIIDNKGIPSREMSNPAILEAIKNTNTQSVLDVGCGEGWLCKKLNEIGIKVFGLDGTVSLIFVLGPPSSVNSF